MKFNKKYILFYESQQNYSSLFFPSTVPNTFYFFTQQFEYQYRSNNTKKMSIVKKCFNCNYQITKWSRKYYCCDFDRLYCMLCNKNRCAACGQLPSSQICQPKCCVCLQFQKEPNQFMYQQICKKYYCLQCLSRQKDIVAHNSIMYPCGHQKNDLNEVNRVQRYIKNNRCRFCSKIFYEILDYSLTNDQKCCSSCFYTKKSLIAQLFHRCMACSQIIRSKKDAHFQDNLLICNNCLQLNSAHQQNKKKQKNIVKPNKQVKNINKEDKYGMQVLKAKKQQIQQQLQKNQFQYQRSNTQLLSIKTQINEIKNQTRNIKQQLNKAINDKNNQFIKMHYQFLKQFKQPQSKVKKQMIKKQIVKPIKQQEQIKNNLYPNEIVDKAKMQANKQIYANYDNYRNYEQKIKPSKHSVHQKYGIFMNSPKNDFIKEYSENSNNRFQNRLQTSSKEKPNNQPNPQKTEGKQRSRTLQKTKTFSIDINNKVSNSRYSEKQCKICLDRESTMVNEECRHMIMCEVCLKQMKQKSKKDRIECPVCKKVGTYQKYIQPIFL